MKTAMLVNTQMWILFWPLRLLGWVFSFIIMPSRYFYNSTILPNWRYIFAGKKDDICHLEFGDRNPDKLVFVMYGNSESILTASSHLQSLLSLLKHKSRDWGKVRIIAFDPPGVNNKDFIFHESQIVEGCFNFVNKKIEQYKCSSDNIVLYGFSIGGAILTHVTALLHADKAYVYCLADRSITNLPDTVIGWWFSKEYSYLAHFCRAVVWLILKVSFGVIDAASAATKIKHGFLHATRYLSKDVDGIVADYASLSQSVPDFCKHIINDKNIFVSNEQKKLAHLLPLTSTCADIIVSIKSLGGQQAHQYEIKKSTLIP